MKPSHIYIVITAIVFLALASVFLLFPRSAYSELEKRELAKFPEFDIKKLASGDYAADLSHWFSDTEPFRDSFMQLSMNVRHKLRYSFLPDGEAITFHAAPQGGADAAKDGTIADAAQENPNANDNFKIASAGILVIGKEPNVRVLNLFEGSVAGGKAFTSAVSQYAAEMPSVKVYAMVIPLASEYYMPDKARKKGMSQSDYTRSLYSMLTSGAKGVDAASALAAHVEEDIYLRTDHHWAPRGAFYAARAFANAAGVPFRELSDYNAHIVKRFVGSMYGYSKDIAVKNSPEDFVYYTPKSATYTTTYRNYKLNDNNQVISESEPSKGPLFYAFKDGSGGAYSTFLGSDQRLTHIHTGVKNGRRLIIIKDSYGNAVPGYLLNSFEDIHVVDFRYFPRNIKKYAADNGITDILFCVNVFNSHSGSVASRMKSFLSQPDGSMAKPTAEEKANNTEAEEEKTPPAEEQTEKKQEEQSGGKTTTTDAPPV